MKPALVFPLEKMYSEKVLAMAAGGGEGGAGNVEEQARKVKKEGDVCGTVGELLLSRLRYFLF